jgi:YD repeat-containing protein
MVNLGGSFFGDYDNGNLAYDGVYRYYYDCEGRLVDINDAGEDRVAAYA